MGVGLGKKGWGGCATAVSEAGTVKCSLEVHFHVQQLVVHVLPLICMQSSEAETGSWQHNLFPPLANVILFEQTSFGSTARDITGIRFLHWYFIFQLQTVAH